MLPQTVFSCLTIFACFYASDGQSINVQKNGITLSIALRQNVLQLLVKEGSTTKLSGSIGRNLVNPSTFEKCDNVENCLQFESGKIRLHVMNTIDYGFAIYWITETTSTVLEDCFELGDVSWFGGPERFEQEWPLNKLNLTNFPNVVQEDQWGAVIEPYWLSSTGAYIFVDEKVPLFINQNTPTSDKKVCFSAKAIAPYPTRNKVVLHYTIAVQENAKEAHLHAVKYFLGKPTGHPNYKIIERPIWSTWARYKRDINDSAVLAFAKEIVDNGYSKGQFEIDDHWEECYGALTFNKSRFNDIASTVEQIKEMGFTATLWVHPFVNANCTKYQAIGRKYNYFVKNTLGSDYTQWWNSAKGDAHYLDFTKSEVKEWFLERLRSIQQSVGIDSFKFDAGESSWSPQVPVLTGDADATPNNIVSEYARTCAKFGDLVEVRVGWRTQDLPVFVRMIDKDSTWGSDNGLYTLITTLLQMNMNGYTMVLPDMVGGNGYYGRPSADLFIRWLQANVFMPSIQFSYVPWDYSDFKTFDVASIAMRMVSLHQKFAPYIKQQMENSIQNGHPVNAPLWWVDPTNKQAQDEDTEFLLGEDIIAAPVITENSIMRNIYLPNGTWIDGNNGVVHEGPVQITNYNAPIDTLPYFVRKGSEAQRINGAGSKTAGVVFVVVMCVQLVVKMF